MKPIISPIGDAKLDKNFSSIREVLGGSVSIDNMLFRVISGVTKPTVDTQSQIIHSMTPRPVAWFPLVGDVYVQEINDRYIDVRATKPGVNFKIILIGGPPVTGESLVAVGDETYQTTDEFASGQVDVPSVSGLDGMSFTVNPGVTLPATGYVSIATDGDYFYLTSSGGTTTELNRINRTTGQVTALTLGTVALGPIKVKVSEDLLYVCARSADSGANTLSIFQVQLSTFTLTTTHVGTSVGSAVSPIVDFCEDTNNFYIPTTTSTGNSRIHKFAKGGGAATVTTLGSTSKAGRGICYASNGSLYVTETDSSVSLSRIYKVNPTTLTVTTTISTANRRYRLGKIIEHSGFLLCPTFTDTSKSTTSQSIRHGFALLAIDLNTNAISEYGIPAFHAAQTVTSSIAHNVVIKDPYIYLVTTFTTQGTSVIRANLDTRETKIQWYPIFSTPVNDSWDTCLIADADGEPLLFYLPLSTELAGLFWLTPTFTEGLDSLFLFE